MNAECNGLAAVRGLCRSCRHTARRIVKKGLVTEEDLEAQGKLLPKCPTRALSPRTIWFLS